MSEPLGETTRLLGRLHEGGPARNELIAHACDRLRRLARKILRDRFPSLRRWEDTDDILQLSLIRLHRALEPGAVCSSAHFWNVAARHVRWALTDLIRHHSGPQADAAHHESSHPSTGQDDPLQRPAIHAEPSTIAQWNEFFDRVEELPSDEQAVFDLLWVQQQTQEQAAAVLDVSVRTIKRRWQSARLRLQGFCD
jgi:RNA polymerase sigma-70 factor (ECF subfamily)